MALSKDTCVRTPLRQDRPAWITAILQTNRYPTQQQRSCRPLETQLNCRDPVDQQKPTSAKSACAVTTLDMHQTALLRMVPVDIITGLVSVAFSHCWTIHLFNTDCTEASRPAQFFQGWCMNTDMRQSLVRSSSTSDKSAILMRSKLHHPIENTTDIPMTRCAC